MGRAAAHEGDGGDFVFPGQRGATELARRLRCQDRGGNRSGEQSGSGRRRNETARRAHELRRAAADGNAQPETKNAGAPPLAAKSDADAVKPPGSVPESAGTPALAKPRLALKAADPRVGKLNETYALVLVGDKAAVMKTPADGSIKFLDAVGIRAVARKQICSVRNEGRHKAVATSEALAPPPATSAV